MALPNSTAPLSPQALRTRIDALPRVRLAHLPTPLEHCPRLTAALGGPQIYIKRDDLTGLAFGGNKTRQLEFLFADILAQGSDIVVAGAYAQSNWCRQITAAARKLGLDAALVLVHGVKGPMLQGNLLLDRLMGADVTVVDLDDMHDLQPLLERRAEALAAEGRRPYIVAPFSLELQSLSAVGYVNAMIELDEQLRAVNARADKIYLAGANMTPAGLAMGARALGSGATVVSISPIRWEDDRATDIARVATATAERLGLGIRIEPGDIVSDDGYIGERYGLLTPEARAALKLVAGTEGIILDPVYSGKAMAGMIDHIRRGRIGRDETVVFVHTGGTPALFAYAEDVMS